MLLELANKRYSLRKFQDKQVEKEKLEKVIEAGRISPTAVNLQPLSYIAITNPELKGKVIDTYSKDWINNAPAIIIVCLDHSKSWKRKDGKDHGDIDGGIAIANMTLAATDQGLGTCIVCNFDTDKLHDLLALPSHMEAIAMLPIGYPVRDDIPKKKRNDLEQIVVWEE